MAVVYPSLVGFGQQFFNNSSVALAGGLLNTYAAGTTTPATTYTTSTGNVAHANPIVLDSAGRIPSGGEVWITNAGFKFVLTDSLGSTIATWDNIVPQIPRIATQTVYTTGSGTYTTKTGCSQIRVQIVGGGGGGSSSCTIAGADNHIGSTGGASSFGNLTCGAGVGGDAHGGNGGHGGTATIGAGFTGIAITGNDGGWGLASNVATVTPVYGGMGGAGPFCGANFTTAPAANSGAGGSGASGATPLYAGHGGGSGAYIDAISGAPSATYAYSVGSGGAGGSAGTGGAGGAGGAAGAIIITEYYYQ